MSKVIFGTIFGLLTLVAVTIAGMYFSFNNEHKDFHTRYDAEYQKIEACVDNMWKIISDKYEVADEYAEQFKEISRINVEAFAPNGEMWKWISTTMPTIDSSTYKELMSTIESQRMRMEQAQKVIIDICREHNNLVSKVPSSWFIADKDKLEYTVITSKESKMIMLTGEDERSIKDLRKN